MLNHVKPKQQAITTAELGGVLLAQRRRPKEESLYARWLSGTPVSDTEKIDPLGAGEKKAIIFQMSLLDFIIFLVNGCKWLLYSFFFFVFVDVL